VKADPFAQLRLLDVQNLDALLDLLAHRRRNLPELTELATLEERRSQLGDQRVEADTDVTDLSAQQRKADADVEQVKARRARNQERLDRGDVGSPKDLASLQSEVQALERRIGVLEDEELEVMELLETAQARLGETERHLGEVDVRIARLAAARDEAFAAIDAEADKANAERQQLAAELPADLLTLYDKLRAQLGGVGAAALQQRRCTGCRLELTPADRARILAAPADEVVRCEECRRILVRAAAESLS
jgi:predicted  nucleic acid-binding Zn-ribbon protein